MRNLKKKKINRFLILKRPMKTLIIQLIVLLTLIMGIQYSLNKVNNIYDFYRIIFNTPSYQEGVYLFGLTIYYDQLFILTVLLFVTIIICSIIYLTLFIVIRRNKSYLININKTNEMVFFILINLLLGSIIISHYIEPIFQNAVTYNFYVGKLMVDYNIYIFKFWTFFGYTLSDKHYEGLHFMIDILFVLIFLFILGLVIVWMATKYKTQISNSED